ncbi:MAG: glycosyltransferase family 4 protein [Gemmatimonadetes bacterium]|nr:glycosyltransferase family 4 protein [Gemmatimonadota bacterium]
MSLGRVPSLRVLHVDAARDWRGGERQLLLLVQGLRARGVEPLVAARPASPLLQRLKTEGIATAALNMRSDLDLLAVRRLRRLIATWRPAVVHAHDGRSQVLALGALVGRRGRIPLVVTRRSAAVPRGPLRFGPRVARFIAISEAVREALRAGGVADARISVAYPGVAARAPERPRDWRAECGWPAGTVVVGIVGPFAAEAELARLESLLAAFPTEVTRQLGLVLLGGHATGRGTVGDVRSFRAGFVHDVPHALAGLDLLLHPGGAEGLGTAVVEAMALGVPSIAFAAGGLAEIVADGVDGALVAPGDTAGFARATARLVTDAEARLRLGAAAPEQAKRFSPDRMVGAVLDVYRDVLERSGV